MLGDRREDSDESEAENGRVEAPLSENPSIQQAIEVAVRVARWLGSQVGRHEQVDGDGRPQHRHGNRADGTHVSVIGTREAKLDPRGPGMIGVSG